LNLLSKADLIDADNPNIPFLRFIYGLTWKGHEFLDLIKNDEIWNQAKEIMHKTGGMNFQVLFQVLLELTIKTTKENRTTEINAKASTDSYVE
jgi:hypothetical protein